MMSQLVRLAWSSLSARRASAMLTVIAVALAVALFSGVEKVRRSAEESFYGAVSGVDVIVGARTGPVNLLLASVFRIGAVTDLMSYHSFETIKARPEVAWAVPMSLGDSHRGYQVVGTTPDYFSHVKHGDRQNLVFSSGAPFDQHELEVVLGSSVARTLGYALSDEIFLSHGVGSDSFHHHDDFHFQVVGVLAPTGTPIDRALLVSLEGVEQIHAGSDSAEHHDHSDEHHHTDPESISAMLVGTTAPALGLRLRYIINSSDEEALTAIIPGETLHALFQIVGVALNALRAVSVFVLAVGLATILIAILTSLNERRREMAILRANGARPRHIFFLVTTEAALLALLGAVAGLALVHVGLMLLAPFVQSYYGVTISPFQVHWTDFAVLLGVPLAASLMATWPAHRALKNALADGLTIRI